MMKEECKMRQFSKVKQAVENVPLARKNWLQKNAWSVILLMMSVLINAQVANASDIPELKPRVVVMTDAEGDDQRSMVRFLHYANESTVEAIIQTNSKHQRSGHSSANGDYWLEKQIEAYGDILPNLLVHNPDYPTEDYLMSRIYLGDLDPNHLVSVPPFASTDGSDKIIELLLDDNSQEIWFQAWGGLNTMAQALYELKFSGNYTDAEWEYASSKTRIFSIASQDYGFDYVKENFPEVVFIYCKTSFNNTYGYYNFYNYYAEYLTEDWISENVSNHGALSDNYTGGLTIRGSNGIGIQEGDTPSFLNFIVNGLNSHGDPAYGGWGGRYELESDDALYYVDTDDSDDIRWYSVTRFIPAAQNDFQARLDWGNTGDYSAANHNPVVVTNMPSLFTSQAGEIVSIQNDSYDPDGDDLTIEWWQYHQADTVDELELNGDSSELVFIVPDDAEEGDTIHIILEVRDSGSPTLTSYERIIVKVTEESDVLVPSESYPPVVTISSPSHGAEYSENNSITITASASDTDGTISSLSFYNNDTLISTDTQAPYTALLENATVGDHTIGVVATDNDGLTATSFITVTVTRDTTGTFVKGINFNGDAVTINGNSWLSEGEAEASGFSIINESRTASSSLTASPAVDTDTNDMLNKGVWAFDELEMEQALANGEYQIYIWIMENYQDNHRTINVNLEGVQVANGIGSLSLASWERYGPYTVTVSDGTLNMGFSADTDPHIMGMEIFQAVTAPVAPLVTIDSPLDGAEYNENDSISITASASDVDGTITSLSFYNNGTLISTDTEAPYTAVLENAAAGAYTISAVAVDNDGLTSTSSITVSVNAVQVAQSPYSGSPISLPGRLEAEAYDLGGEGVAYYDTTDGTVFGEYRGDSVDVGTCSDTDGGYRLGNVAAGEWLEYTVDVATGGSYSISTRTATVIDDRQMHIEIDGVDVTGAINIPNTGSWQTWETTSVTGINLTAGEHVVRVAFDTSHFDLNWIDFALEEEAETEEFVLGVNVNGDAVTIDGNLWLSHDEASAAGFSVTGNAWSGNVSTLEPSTTSDIEEMLGSVYYQGAGDLDITQTLPDGKYRVGVWMVENYISNFRQLDVTAEGEQVLEDIGTLDKWGWKRYEFNTTVSDGVLNIHISRDSGDSQIMGLDIYKTLD